MRIKMKYQTTKIYHDKNREVLLAKSKLNQRKKLQRKIYEQ